MFADIAHIAASCAGLFILSCADADTYDETHKTLPVHVVD